MFDFSAQMKAFKAFSDLAMQSAKASTEAMTGTIGAAAEISEAPTDVAPRRARTMAAARSGGATKRSKVIVAKSTSRKASAKKKPATRAAVTKSPDAAKTTARTTAKTKSKPTARTAAKTASKTLAKAPTRKAVTAKAGTAKAVTAKAAMRRPAAKAAPALAKAVAARSTRPYSGPPMEPFALAQPEHAQAAFADFSRSLMAFWTPQLAANVCLNGDAGGDIDEGMEATAVKHRKPARSSGDTTVVTEAASSMMEAANPFFWFDAITDAMMPAEIAPEPEPEPEPVNYFDPATYFDAKTWTAWLDNAPNSDGQRKLPTSRTPSKAQYGREASSLSGTTNLPDAMQKMMDPFGIMGLWMDAAEKVTSSPLASAFLPQPAAGGSPKGGLPGFGSFPGFGDASGFDRQNPFQSMFQNPFMPANAAPMCAPFAMGNGGSQHSLFGTPSGMSNSIPGMMMITLAMPFDPMAVAKKMMGMH